MDEPFGALDALTKMRLQKELLNIWHRLRKTIIYVTHDIDEALLLSDRIMVMTGKPARIRKIIKNSLPRPRLFSQWTNPAFLHLKRKLIELLK